MVANAVVDRVITPEVRDVAQETADVFRVEQIGGLAYIAVVGTVGVAIAQQIVDLVMPRLNMSPDPSTTLEFAAAGLVQFLWAGIVAGLTIAVIGTGGNAVLFATGILLALGSLVIAGANLFEAGQRFLSDLTSGSGSAPASSSGGQRRTRREAPQNSPSTGGGNSDIAAAFG